MMGSLAQDLRYVLRQLRKTPGFTLTAILTLAFGIGATTAIFSIVEGVLLRPLPFPDEHSLVALGDILEGVKYGLDAPGVTAPGVQIYMRETHAFTNLGAYQPADYELSGRAISNPAQVNATRLTASLFPTLGVTPLLGRTFTTQEDESGQLVTVLSFQTWRNRFQSDPHILGQTIYLDRKAYQVIGVMPRDFEFPLLPGQLSRCELWLPMSFTPSELIEGAGAWAYYVVGRLKPGISSAQAQQDAATAAAEIMRHFPPALASRRIHPQVQSLNEATIAQSRPLVRMLFLAVIVVLFIACANLAGLLLVRGLARRREVAVRFALGATKAAVLCQSLVESLLLSLAGGLIGLVLAWVALRIGIGFLPETLPRVQSISLDWTVVAFALALAALTGFLCGLLPALAAAGSSFTEALKEGGRTGSSGGSHIRLRSTLVVSELAVALVLLTASGLLLRSFQKMRSVDLGFDPGHTLTANFNLPPEQYHTQADIDAFNQNLRTRLESLPGVLAVGTTTLLPADQLGGYRGTFTPEGYDAPQGAGLNLAWIPQVSGRYFEAQGIPLLRGRTFTAADTASSQLVAIVNRALAEHYWPGQDPIGKRIHRGPKEGALPWITIVGEIGDIKESGADAPSEEQYYLPVSQIKSGAGPFAAPDMVTGNIASIVLRTQLPPEQMAQSLRSAVHALDPQLPLTHVESMDQVVAEGQASRRFNTALVSAFAAAALLLAILGIYSVIAFAAALRTSEMAIRLALGSPRAAIMRLILVSGAKLGLAGCLIGVVAAAFAAHLIRSMLFEVDPIDPAVIALSAIAIFLLAIAASILPARRAAAIEPIQALRSE